MTRPVILCTLPMSAAGAAIVAPVADIVVVPDQKAQTLYAMINDADILLVRTHLPHDLFDRPNRLIGVVRNGTGLDMIPVESATAHGIPVANVPGANAQSVAEYCIGSFLMLARRFDAMDRDLRGKDWATARAHSAGTNELAGKTVGIVGMGTIGAALAKACHYGFGMRVLAYQPSARQLPDFVERADLDDLLAASDYVSLNCPLTSQTKHLMNEARLRRMKPTAVLVNAARGEVVDEAALARALRERWIKGAAIDVYSEQPLRRDHPLLQVDNAILTPHVAALTAESFDKMSTGAARQILQLLDGVPPDHLVNPEVWPRRRQPEQ
jgi:D-3-phosphoglycerate dehydrogenase